MLKSAVAQVELVLAAIHFPTRPNLLHKITTHIRIRPIELTEFNITGVEVIMNLCATSCG